MDDLEAVARMGTAQLRALVSPPRRCRVCGAELEDPRVRDEVAPGWSPAVCVHADDRSQGGA